MLTTFTSILRVTDNTLKMEKIKIESKVNTELPVRYEMYHFKEFPDFDFVYSLVRNHHVIILLKGRCHEALLQAMAFLVGTNKSNCDQLLLFCHQWVLVDSNPGPVGFRISAVMSWLLSLNTLFPFKSILYILSAQNISLTISLFADWITLMVLNLNAFRSGKS